VPPGYEDEEPVQGRPRERASFIGTQDDPLGGRDRLGTKMTGAHDYNDPKSQSKLSEARRVFLTNKEHLFSKVPTVQNEAGLLNEDNIKGLND